MNIMRFDLTIYGRRRAMAAALVAVMTLLSVSCGEPMPDVVPERSVLVYFAANNDISEDARRDYRDIIEGWIPEEGSGMGLLVYHHFAGESPVLLRIYKDGRGDVVEKVVRSYGEGWLSVSGDAMREVLSDAEAAYPVPKRGLVLWSHGSGWLPPGYYRNPWDRAAGSISQAAGSDPYAAMVKGAHLKGFGTDGAEEMDIRDLAAALEGRHYGYILMDCCLMGCAEVMWELKDACDWIVSSPTEILTDGFPYKDIIEPMLRLDSRAAMERACLSYMEHYRGLSGEMASASVSLVRTEALPALAAAYGRIVSKYRPVLWALEKDDLQPYFRGDRHWFWDLGDVVSHVADETEYQAFSRALKAAVPFHDETEMFLTIPMRHCCGLSTYLPPQGGSSLNEYYRKLGWDLTVGLVGGFPVD